MIIGATMLLEWTVGTVPKSQVLEFRKKVPSGMSTRLYPEIHFLGIQVRDPLYVQSSPDA